MCDFKEDSKKLATVSKMAKNNLDCDVEVVELNQGDYLKYLNEFSFHPNGNTGCILSNDDYMFGIRCDHLIWIEGWCEGVEKFWTEKDDEYRAKAYSREPKFTEHLGYDVRDIVDCEDRVYNAIMVLGNHKGTFMQNLVVFHQK